VKIVCEGMAKLEIRSGLYEIKPVSKMISIEYARRTLYWNASRKTASHLWQMDGWTMANIIAVGGNIAV
jgi:hypothetical protein